MHWSTHRSAHSKRFWKINHELEIPISRQCRMFVEISALTNLKLVEILHEPQMPNCDFPLFHHVIITLRQHVPVQILKIQEWNARHQSNHNPWLMRFDVIQQAFWFSSRSRFHPVVESITNPTCRPNYFPSVVTHSGLNTLVMLTPMITFLNMLPKCPVIPILNAPVCKLWSNCSFVLPPWFDDLFAVDASFYNLSSSPTLS